MRVIFALMAGLFFIQIASKSQAAETNCRWQAERSGKKLGSAGPCHSFFACSILIRGLILGGGLGPLGAETEGTLIFENSTGSKRVCPTKPTRSNAKRLDEKEHFSSYLYAEATGAVPPHDCRVGFLKGIKGIGLDPLDVVRKIEKATVLEFEPAIS